MGGRHQKHEIDCAWNFVSTPNPGVRGGPTLKQACLEEYLEAQCAFKDSMIHVCKSYYVSQFAAFFIDARTKRSVVESFDFFVVLKKKN